MGGDFGGRFRRLPRWRPHEEDVSVHQDPGWRSAACRELRQLLSEALGESRALSGGGDGDLQRSSLHDRGIVEIAEPGNIDDVAEDAPLGCFSKDALVKFSGGCSRDDQKHVFQIARLERALKPLDTVRLRPGAHLWGRLGRHYAYLPAGLQEAGDFRLGDRSRSDDEAPPGRELEEHGEELCRLHVFRRRAPC